MRTPATIYLNRPGQVEMRKVYSELLQMLANAFSHTKFIMMSFFKSIKTNQTIITMAATVTLAILTGVYVVLTLKAVKLSQKQVDAMIETEKKSFHRELVENLYFPILKWLEQLADPFQIISRVERVPPWRDFKENLSHYVYYLKKSHMESLCRVDSLLNEFEKNKGNFKKSLCFLTFQVLLPKMDSSTDNLRNQYPNTWPLIQLSLPSRENYVLHELVCSDERLKKILEIMKDNDAQIIWEIRIDTHTITENHDSHIRPLGHKEFEAHLQQINSTIQGDEILCSWMSTLSQLNNNSKDLLFRIGAEMEKFNDSF